MGEGDTIKPGQVSKRIVKKIRSISLLPPKDKRFYDLFNEMTDNLVEASGELIRLFDTPIQMRHEIEVKIHACSVRCNRVGNSIEELLLVAQQPPFDRADISDLVAKSMKVMKFIKHAANRYVIYNFPTSDKEMRELAPLINSACLEIAAAFKKLPGDRKLGSYCDAVEQFEFQADNVYHQGLSCRFAEIRQDRVDVENQISGLTDPSSEDPDKLALLAIDKSTVEYIRHVAVFFILRQVYAELERAIDACTEVTAALRRMVSKNV